ncbi:MAG: hypothetical protein FGM54_07200 [Chitinophagaceae bacterium]|nr:hypothetical protein [Chitinophagaceae bacterium]
MAWAQKKEPIDSLSHRGTPPHYFSFNTKVPNPKRAGFYSALFPGLGQTYNKQYWKTGLVYMGLGALGLVTQYNAKQYRFYQGIYQGRMDNDSQTSDTLIQYSTEDINTLRKAYRTYTEYSVIGISAFYAINIIDAFVSAHLKTFDMSRDISLKVQPTFNQFRQPGIRCTFALNR